MQHLNPGTSSNGARCWAPLQVTGFPAALLLPASSPLASFRGNEAWVTLWEGSSDTSRNGQPRARVPFAGSLCNELLQDTNPSGRSPSPWGARSGATASFPPVLTPSFPLLSAFDKITAVGSGAEPLAAPRSGRCSCSSRGDAGGASPASGAAAALRRLGALPSSLWCLLAGKALGALPLPTR